jgi:hypothetical protein
MMIGARWLAAATLITGCTAVTAAYAGNLSFLADTPVAHFNSEDMALMKDTADKVLDSPDANAQQSWSNPRTRSSGMAQVRDQFTAANGTPCKRLRIVNRARGLESDATYTVCKTADRGWIFNADAAPAR